MNSEPTRLWHIFSWDSERVERSRCYGSLLASSAALITTLFIPHQNGWNVNSATRLGLYGAGLGFAIGANRSAYRLGQSFPYRKVAEDAYLDVYCNASAAVVAGQQVVDQMAYVPIRQTQEISSAGELSQAVLPITQPVYDWNRIKNEAVQLAIIGNSGAGKDCCARFFAGMFGNLQMLVLDPHNKNQPWRPLFVVQKMQAIVKQMKLLLEELDLRIEEGQEGLPSRPPLIVFINEWLSIVAHCKKLKLKLADEFITRMGPEARKYDILCCFLVASDSADAMGLEGNAGLKGCFWQVRLHNAAKNYVRNHSDRHLREYVLSHTGFTCLVNDEIAQHPTHGHYERFAKELPPANLRSLTAVPLTIPLAVVVDGEVEIVDGWEPVTPGSSGSNSRFEQESDRFTQSNCELPNEPLNRPQDKDEPISREPELKPLDERSKRLLQLLELKRQGFNKTDCIERLWGIKKGGSPKYDLASEMYDRMIQELRSLGELD